MAPRAAASLARSVEKSFRHDCAVCWRRSFHASSTLSRRIPSSYDAARSTRRKAIVQQPGYLQNPEQNSWAESLRQDIFKMAEKNQYLRCDYATAEKIYADLQRRRNIDGPGVLALAKENNVELIAITAIARLLLRQTNSFDMTKAGSSLLTACADAGELHAILGVARIGLKRGELGKAHFQKYMRKVIKLADSGSSRTAQIIYAAELERRGNFKEAIRRLEMAVNTEDDAQQSDEQKLDHVMRDTDDSTWALSNAHVEIGRLYMDYLGDVEKARSAYETGAFVADDPQAYFGLADFEVNFNDENVKIVTEKWVEYLTKAAASGHNDAQMRLADFYAMTEAQAQERTTPGAFEVYRKYASKRYSKSLTWAEWPLYLNVLFRHLLKHGLNKTFPRKPERFQNNRAWALEWYRVSAEPPPVNIPAYMSRIRCFHEGGSPDVAGTLAESALERRKDKSPVVPLSPQDRKALEQYRDTGDGTYLKGLGTDPESILA